MKWVFICFSPNILAHQKLLPSLTDGRHYNLSQSQQSKLTTAKFCNSLMHSFTLWLPWDTSCKILLPSLTVINVTFWICGGCQYFHFCCIAAKKLFWGPSCNHFLGCCNLGICRGLCGYFFVELAEQWHMIDLNCIYKPLALRAILHSNGGKQACAVIKDDTLFQQTHLSKSWYRNVLKDLYFKWLVQHNILNLIIILPDESHYFTKKSFIISDQQCRIFFVHEPVKK